MAVVPTQETRLNQYSSIKKTITHDDKSKIKKMWVKLTKDNPTTHIFANVNLNNKIQGQTDVINVTTSFLMMIHPRAKFGMPMSKSKDDLAHTQIHDEM